MTIPNGIQRSADRFRPEGSVPIEAQLLLLEDDEFVSFPCQLSDISTGGCAVKVALPERFKASVAVIQFNGLIADTVLEVAGRLCWNQKTSLCSKTLGFRFRFPLDIETLHTLVERGVITRRAENREPCDMELTVRRSHGKPTVDRSSLRDVSTTGVRLQIDQPVEIGERILLVISPGRSNVDVPISVSATVVWLVQSDDSLECGCRFNTLSAARTFLDALAVASN